MTPTRIPSLVASLCVAVTATIAASDAGAQTRDSVRKDSVHVDKTFFTRRDLIWSGVAVAGSAAVSLFDKRIAHWTQTPSIQGSKARQDLFNDLTVVNEQPLTLGAVAVYGIGRLTGSGGIAALGLHATEALVLTVGSAELIRSPLGRARPRLAPDNAYDFSLDKGFTDFARRSFPSIHSAVGFATASVLVGELRERHPSTVPYAEPILYAAALVPGLTRMYLNQHWASDVVSGAFLGTLMGSRVVSYAYSHKPSRFDRALLGVSVVPDSHGGVLVMKSFTE